MSASVLAAALVSWTLQSALLLGVGLLLPALFRLRNARACLAYGQGLLAAALLLPLLQPAREMASFSGELSVARFPGVGAAWLGRLASAGEGPWSLPRLLLAGLVAGVAVRLVWIALGLLALRRYRRQARPAELAPAVAELAGVSGGQAHFLVSDRIGSPVTFGWRSPVVLLHAGFADLPLSAQRGIVCHELVHVRRRDWLWALAEEAFGALLWFHPVFRLLLSRIALYREQVVDREAVRLTGSRRAYLEALRSVALRSWPEPLSGLPFFHRGHLCERVALLCKEVPMSRSRVTALLTTCAALLALTAVLGILAFPMAGTAWAGGKPMKIEGDVKPPKVLQQADPVYPQEARKSRIEGTVVLKTVIDEQGKVKSPTIGTSSGNKELDQAALDAVSTWTFKPATLANKAVPVYYTLTIRFSLSKEK